MTSSFPLKLWCSKSSQGIKSHSAADKHIISAAFFAIPCPYVAHNRKLPKKVWLVTANSTSKKTGWKWQFSRGRTSLWVQSLPTKSQKNQLSTWARAVHSEARGNQVHVQHSSVLAELQNRNASLLNLFTALCAQNIFCVLLISQPYTCYIHQTKKNAMARFTRWHHDDDDDDDSLYYIVAFMKTSSKSNIPLIFGILLVYDFWMMALNSITLIVSLSGLSSLTYFQC